MKKVCLFIFAVLLILGGCGVDETANNGGIWGYWYCVEDKAALICFNEDESGHTRVDDTEGNVQVVDFTWSYDDTLGEYVLTGDREYRVRFSDRRDVRVLLFDGRRYVKRQDHPRMRSEYLAELSQKVSQQLPREERMAALIEEYGALFHGMARVEMGRFYPMPVYQNSIRFIKAWKSEDARLHLEMEVKGGTEPMHLSLYTNGLTICEWGYMDAGAVGMEMYWYLYGTNTSEEAFWSDLYAIRAGKAYTVDFDWHFYDYEARRLAAVEELAGKYGFWDDREAVFAAIREAGLPTAYALVDLTDDQPYLLDFTDLLMP